MRYRLVCFDMDGVLYSSERMIAGVFRKAALEYAAVRGLAVTVPELPEIMEQIGRPISVIFSSLFPGLSPEQQREISLLTLQELVTRVRAREGSLLPGAFDVLRTLAIRGVQLGLASNGRAPYLDAILETYNLVRFFPDRAVIDGKALPDKGSLITHAMARHGIGPRETLMVGDRLTDWEAARQAGVDFACVLSGHGSDFTDQPLDHAIHRLAELLPIVSGKIHARV